MFIIKTQSRNDVLFLNSVFRFSPGLKMSFKFNSVRKSLFLSASFFWDSGFSLREMDQKIKFVGLIGYRNFCLDSVFHYSNLCRLHSILHDAAGAVRSHTGKGPGYCYMIGQGPNSCLLGHVTGLLFCLYDRLFAVFYAIKVLNAEVFAKGLEKCRLLSRLRGQNVENLDDYGCPKYRDLDGEANSSWMCSTYLLRHITRLHCAERKAKVYGVWAMQHL